VALPADPNESPRVGEGFKAPPVTLCAWCGHPFTPKRRGSPQLYCKPSHRVAAHRATKQGAIIGKPRPRHRTRRTEYPHGCWQHQDTCLLLHHECSCKRCRYNVCECVQFAPATMASVPVSGLLVLIPGRLKM